MRSMSAFLQMRQDSRRPMPLIAHMAYMTFCRPSTFVFRIRSTYWKSSPIIIVMMGRLPGHLTLSKKPH